MSYCLENDANSADVFTVSNIASHPKIIPFNLRHIFYSHFTLQDFSLHTHSHSTRKPAHVMTEGDYLSRVGLPLKKGTAPLMRGACHPPQEASFHFASWLQKKEPKLN